MKLSVLDQSPVMAGLGARRAIEETIALARRADGLGYHRYWLAEHHAIAALADPCPEVLLARLGAETRRMRVGTGGVLLPYYSAFRTAESFRMLEALYPGRIDLGVGRAPGGDARTAQAVGGGRFPDAASFPQQVWELTALLEGEHQPVRLQPEVDTVPEVWLLGSSDYSGALAAELGLPFAFAHFINPNGGDVVSRSYRDSFKATQKRPHPRVIVCTFAILADSDDEAERHRYSGEERRYVLSQRARAVIGGSQKAKRELQTLVERYGADELMVLTITGDYDSRRRSYELLIDAF